MPRFHFATAGSALVFAAMLTLAATTAADARPKRITNGCTDEQIQSAAAAQCIDKMKDDILHNRPTFHALYCSAVGTMRCCEYNQDGSTVPHSCELVSSRANPGIYSPNDLVDSFGDGGGGGGGNSLLYDGDHGDEEPPPANPDGPLY